MSALRERIRRALLMVPLVRSREGGFPAGELAARLGVPVETLDAEIEFLMMVGRPPFSPADFLDLYLEGGKVHVSLALCLERPPRLTHDETLALAVGAQAAIANAGPTFADELEGAIAKLEAAMTGPERARYQAMRARIVAGVAPGNAPDGTAPEEDDVHAVLRAAIEAEQPLSIDYYTASRDARGKRVVHPYALLSDQGSWYLLAGPEADGAPTKLYRLDRIQQARPVGVEGDARMPETIDLEALRAGRFLRGAGDTAARVHVSKRKARFAAEPLPPEDCQVQDDGSVEITFPFASWAWVSAWVLSFAPDARVLEPPGLVERVRADAAAALARYTA